MIGGAAQSLYCGSAQARSATIDHLLKLLALLSGT